VPFLGQWSAFDLRGARSVFASGAILSKTAFGPTLSVAVEAAFSAVILVVVEPPSCPVIGIPGAALKAPFPSSVVVSVKSRPPAFSVVLPFPVKAPFPSSVAIAVKSRPPAFSVVPPFPVKSPFPSSVVVSVPRSGKPIPVRPPSLTTGRLIFRERFRRAFAHPERSRTGDRVVFKVGLFRFVGVHPEVAVGVVDSEG